MFSIDVYKDNKAPAFVLLATTLKRYGMSALEEEPAILREKIEKDLNIKLSDLQSNKLQAAICTLLTEQIEYDWRAFEVAAHAFNNEDVEHDVLLPLEAEEIAVALAEIVMIKSSILHKNEIISYGEDVRGYLGLIFFDYGFVHPPKIFPQAIIPMGSGDTKNEEIKNEALTEIFNAHVEYILDYIEKLN